MVKRRNTSKFFTNPGKKTWMITLPNTTLPTSINMSDLIMFTQTNLQPFSFEHSSLAFGKGVLKSLGIPTPRSSDYHVLGILLISQSPQVSLTTKYLASHESSTGYPHHRTILEEYN
jgi:hypothetical protein